MVSGPVPVTSDDPQTRLLAEFGRSRVAEATRTTIARFCAAFDRADVDAVMAAMTTDCVFESTAPPDGQRHQGQDAVRRAWSDFFAAAKGAVFETEELIVADDRAIARWRYTWAPGAGGHVRGIDLFRVRDGLVAEKLSYVKG
jgi:ketosteroid isomerase-like protein